MNVDSLRSVIDRRVREETTVEKEKLLTEYSVDFKSKYLDNAHVSVVSTCVKVLLRNIRERLAKLRKYIVTNIDTDVVRRDERIYMTVKVYGLGQ